MTDILYWVFALPFVCAGMFHAFDALSETQNEKSFGGLVGFGAGMVFGAAIILSQVHEETLLFEFFRWYAAIGFFLVPFAIGMNDLLVEQNATKKQVNDL